MKKQDLLNLGFTDVEAAFSCFKQAAKGGRFKAVTPRKAMKDVAQNPSAYVDDEHFGEIARKLLAEGTVPDKEPIKFKYWGEVDENTRAQMQTACELPVAIKAALMADSHLGYGLSIGGVLATENSVIPYAVGVDIACRVKMSVIDIPVETLEKELKGEGIRKGDRLTESLQNGTRFGIGSRWSPKRDHPVMDSDWKVTQITKALRDKSWEQLGTSGSGNHFVEIGILDVPNEITLDKELPKGRYLAILSHSGSRGAGAKVCSEYSGIAKGRLDKRYKDRFGYLAWLDMDSEAGQEYWAAMNLMGEYAKANHAVIHRTVAELLGAEIIADVEHHHNYCWEEVHDGKKLYVHRKGATPAGKGVLGIIPGSMADPCYVVVGKGNPDSLMSSSHGAGRRLSRTEAKKRFNWHEWRSVLKQRGVRLISAGLDEVPGSYKDIREVMRAQSDLVDVIAQFDPKIVKMSDDGRSED